MSPQVYLDSTLRSRGYSTQRFKTLQTSYHNRPTPLQEASYSVHMIGLVRGGEVEKLKDIMASGISPNPCNSFGESLIHNVCRRGDAEILDIFVKNGCHLNVCDDYGRTPLHDACWAAEPAFDVVKMILEKDVRLFHMIDSRERLPLGYIREEHWPMWVEFLDSHKDIYWPERNTDEDEPPPRMTQQGPNTRPLPNPDNALTVEMAAMVASGRMTPQEVMLIKSDEDGTTAETGDSDDDSFSDSDGEYDSDEDFDDDEIVFDEEMHFLLHEMSSIRAQTVATGNF